MQKKPYRLPTLLRTVTYLLCDPFRSPATKGLAAVKITTEEHAIEIDFIDSTCGCRKTIRLEAVPDGEWVTIIARSYPPGKGEMPKEERAVQSFSAVKAIASAILLLEV